MNRRPDQWVWPAVPSAARYPSLKAAIHLTAEDALRLALSAYYAAVRDLQPPPGSRWLVEGDGVLEPLPWASPRDLHDGFLHHLGERLWAHAAATGHLDPEESPVGAGRSPAAKGHGCPASAAGGFSPAVAVGPAPAAAPIVDITTPGNPLFCASGVQKLPGLNAQVNLEPEGEKKPC